MPTLSRLAISVCLIGSWLAAAAAAQTASSPGVPGSVLTLAGRPVELTAGFVRAGTARFHVAPLDAQGNALAPVDAPFLTPQQWQGEPIRERTTSRSSNMHFAGKMISVNTLGTTWTIRLAPDSGSGPAQEVRIDSATGAIHFPLGDGPIFGMGQGGNGLDRRGIVDPMVDVGNGNNYPWPTNVWGERLAIPWLTSPNGWGLFLDAPHGSMDLTGADGIFTPDRPGGRGRGRGAAGAAGRGAGRGRGRGAARGADGATTGTTTAAAAPTATPTATPAPAATPAGPPPPMTLDGFIVVASDPSGAAGPASLMKAYADITGYPALPPLYTFGYQQSSREIASDEQILGIAKTFREKGMPCDMLIYLSTGYAMPHGWNLGLGTFGFDQVTFPHPEEELKQFHDMHFKVVLHENHAPRDLHGNATDPVTAAPDNWSDIGNYWAQHLALMKMGVDGWWPDEGEELSAASRLDRIRMYYEGPQMLAPNQRSYNLDRTGTIGMQRYAAFLWSGDIQSTWQVLERQIAAGLNAAIGATPYWGTDTGGFYPGGRGQANEMTGELFARWFQFSAFCPLFRSHGQSWVFYHLPWGFSDSKNPKHDDAIEPICKQYLDLRYQMMPYLYSLVYESHDTGMPIMRELWLQYPKDAKSLEQKDEYLWGADMLVAPVVEKGATERKLYLPPGDWIDYWTNEKVAGGKEVIKKVDLATMPLYARAGAIVPLGPIENYTAEKPNDPLTIVIYPGKDGHFQMVEDDGITISAKPSRIGLTWSDATKTLRVAMDQGTTLQAPNPRHLQVKMAGMKDAKQATFTGATLEVKF